MATSITDDKETAVLGDTGAAPATVEAQTLDSEQTVEQPIEKASGKEPVIAPIELTEALLSQLVKTAPKLDRSKVQFVEPRTVRSDAAAGEPAMVWVDAPTIAESKVEPGDWNQRGAADEYDWRTGEAAASGSRPADVPPAAAKDKMRAPSVGTFVMFAASMAIAAALGAMGGALGASGLVRLGPAPVQAVVPQVAAGPSEETRVLQGTIAQLRTDLAALKSSVEGGTKTTGAQIANANSQIAKMADRFDRLERAQAEPAAKIAKVIETLERMEKRNEPPKDTTGSVPAAQQQAAVSPSQQQPINGWSVREVYRGIAVLKGPRFGLIEVEAGDTVPGIGRVEAVRRQDGQWVVVTSKGVIKSAN